MKSVHHTYFKSFIDEKFFRSEQSLLEEIVRSAKKFNPVRFQMHSQFEEVTANNFGYFLSQFPDKHKLVVVGDETSKTKFFF